MAELNGKAYCRADAAYHIAFLQDKRSILKSNEKGSRVPMTFCQLIHGMMADKGAKKEAFIGKVHDNLKACFSVYGHSDWNIRSGMLHSWGAGGFSFDAARCDLLFFDCIMQKMNRKKENKEK